MYEAYTDEKQSKIFYDSTRNKLSSGALDFKIKDFYFGDFVEFLRAKKRSLSNDVNDVLNTLEKMDLKECTLISVVPFEQFIRVMTAVKDKFDINSKSVAFLHMIRICEQCM